MKKFICFVAILLSFTLSYAVTMAGQGNNLPSGPRYMLNVIAFDNCPAGDFTGSNRHMIAVQANFDLTTDPTKPLTGTQAGKLASDLLKTNTISLKEGSEFQDLQVLDGNACNNDGGAEFVLPPPYTCPVDDPTCANTVPAFEYRVFVRLVGKPKTGIGVTTCATETVTDVLGTTEDIIACSTENVVKYRMTGKDRERFVDVSPELLTICLDTDLDGKCNIRYPLFAPQLSDYFWQWNTSGKAHAQLVFIPN